MLWLKRRGSFGVCLDAPILTFPRKAGEGSYILFAPVSGENTRGGRKFEFAAQRLTRKEDSHL